MSEPLDRDRLAIILGSDLRGGQLGVAHVLLEGCRFTFCRRSPVAAILAGAFNGRLPWFLGVTHFLSHCCTFFKPKNYIVNRIRTLDQFMIQRGTSHYASTNFDAFLTSFLIYTLYRQQISFAIQSWSWLLINRAKDPPYRDFVPTQLLIQTNLFTHTCSNFDVNRMVIYLT